MGLGGHTGLLAAGWRLERIGDYDSGRFLGLAWWRAGRRLTRGWFRGRLERHDLQSGIREVLQERSDPVPGLGGSAHDDSAQTLRNVAERRGKPVYRGRVQLFPVGFANRVIHADIFTYAVHTAYVYPPNDHPVTSYS